MSWYNGTFYCGHEGYVYINGSAQMRRKMKEYRFSQPCPECIRSDAIRFRQQKNTEALEHTRHAELPLLEGSARQISWASTLRLDICQRLENYIAISSHHTYLAECWERQSGTAIDPGDDDLPQFFQELVYYLQNIKRQSNYWINSRYLSNSQILLNAIPEYLTWRQQKKSVFLQENQICAESILTPLQVRHPGFVVIKTDSHQLRAYYEKQPDFQRIMKQNRFHWNGSFWHRTLSEYSGLANDRIAQLGNALLLEGFRISIDDPATREQAIHADFLPEHSHWIRRGMNGQQFFITLAPDFPQQLRQNLLRIPTAAYRYGSVLIDVAHYEELEDFARIYDFYFDHDAQSLLNNYKKLLDNSRRVQPVLPEQPQSLDQLRLILESSGSILEELCDDEVGDIRKNTCD